MDELPRNGYNSSELGESLLHARHRGGTTRPLSRSAKMIRVLRSWSLAKPILAGLSMKSANKCVRPLHVADAVRCPDRLSAGSLARLLVALLRSPKAQKPSASNDHELGSGTVTVT